MEGTARRDDAGLATAAGRGALDTVPEGRADVGHRSAVRRRRTTGVVLTAVALVASAAAAGAVGLRAGAEPSPPSAVAAPLPIAYEPPLTAVPAPPTTVSALRTAQVDGAAFAPATARFDPPRLAVGKDISVSRWSPDTPFRTAAVVFPPFDQAGRCLGEVVLRLTVTDVSGGAAEVAAYPSAAAESLLEGRAPRYGGSGVLLDNRPRGLADVVPGQREVVLDVTAMARLWADGNAFPSDRRRVAPGTPFAVLLRPPGADDGTYEVTLLADGPAEQRPRLDVCSSCPTG